VWVGGEVGGTKRLVSKPSYKSKVADTHVHMRNAVEVAVVAEVLIIVAAVVVAIVAHGVFVVRKWWQ
jgi:hypothetical protein